MTWITPKLTKRVSIGKPTMTPNEQGGMDFSFTTLMTVWMGFKNLGYYSAQARYVRGQQVAGENTHEFVVLRLSVASLGQSFSLGFSSGFKSMSDLMPLKSEYFLFVQEGSSVKGRLFRIHDLADVGENREYLYLLAEEIEERGAGQPN